MPFSLDEEQKESLKRFMERRNLRDRTLKLFEKTSNANDLKRGGLTQNKNATYANLVDGFEKAIKNKWLNEQDLIDLLDESEIAGRQHVCVYQLPETGAKAILNVLKDPDESVDEVSVLSDFWDVPDASYARVVRESASEVLVKIVAKRKYWRAELSDEYSTETEQWVRRWVVEERSAVVIKCVLSSGILQVRVPPKEQQTQVETGKSIREFAMQILSRHYDVGKNSWFSKLQLFPISDAYNKILKNKTDFCMRHDTPESDTARSRLSKKGSIKKLEDLRDDEMWKFGKGFARKTMRGTWTLDGAPVYTHLNLDEVKLKPKGKAEYARVFFPYLATDAQVDHAIKRISDHI